MTDKEFTLTNQELAQLDTISKNSLYSCGVMTPAIQYCFRILKRYLRGRRILELGPAEGVMTELLSQTGMELTVVEGSSVFCESLRLRFPAVKVVHALFEQFEPDEKYDVIVLGHVLEHVQDPRSVLLLARSWLQPNGIIFAAVPNARSLHRQAAVVMDLLPQEDALNDKDRHHGHRIVFNPESFRAAFIRVGFVIDVFGGYWLKPVSNSQIENTWTPSMVEAFMQLGERYPDIAGEIYVVASNNFKKSYENRLDQNH
jgi:2-polyprenyl-3-methyl-5-hydroxy-6-metoxy-1,4-benzoquinol methylase